MEIIPAIDLKGGKCVRLYQGDFSRVTVFSDDPVRMALRWQDKGAGRLHIVDLDGAAAGKLGNEPLITAIVRQLRIPIQVGGGIRDKATAARLLSLGVHRVVLGTVAVEQPESVKEMARRYGDAIVVSLDARDGFITSRGWQQASKVKAVSLGLELKQVGVARLICTDISRDGTLTQPNYDAIEELLKAVSLPVIASGGVASLSHLEKLKELGVEGVIIGKALYTGDIKLPEALSLAAGQNGSTPANPLSPSRKGKGLA